MSKNQQNQFQMPDLTKLLGGLGESLEKQRQNLSWQSYIDLQSPGDFNIEQKIKHAFFAFAINNKKTFYEEKMYVYRDNFNKLIMDEKSLCVYQLNTSESKVISTTEKCYFIGNDLALISKELSCNIMVNIFTTNYKEIERIKDLITKKLEP